MDSKIIALAAVVIVVVAAVAVGVVVMNDDDDDDKGVTIDSPVLQVYGNVNGDYYVDNSDLKELKSLVKNVPENWKETNPFADVDHNNKLDNADVTMLESILAATPENQVKVNINSYALGEAYVSSVRYPIVSASCNSNQTTMVCLKTIGIDSEIKATSLSSSNLNSDGTVKTEKYDRVVFASFLDSMDKAHQIGTASAEPSSSLVSKMKDEYKVTCYFYSSSNAQLEKSKTSAYDGLIDLFQVADGMSTYADWGSAMLLYGFLFDCEGKGYMNNAVKAVEWMGSFTKDLKDHTEKITSDGKLVSGAASSMYYASSGTYISIKGSSNTDIVEQAGLFCPVSKVNPEDGSKMTMTYKQGTDSWLNMIDLDTIVALKGSDSGWSWFDGDYTSSALPSSYATHLKSVSSLSCYKAGKLVLVSTMIPGPLKSGVIAEHFYADYFDAGWFNGYLQDFLTTFWGFTAEQCNGLKCLLTQSEVIATA